MTDALQIRSTLLYAIPLLYLLVALIPALVSLFGTAASPNLPAPALARNWRWARRISGVTVFIACISLVWLAMSGAMIAPPKMLFGAALIRYTQARLSDETFWSLTFVSGLNRRPE